MILSDPQIWISIMDHHPWLANLITPAVTLGTIVISNRTKILKSLNHPKRKSRPTTTKRRR
jgi:hypothetical protein